MHGHEQTMSALNASIIAQHSWVKKPARTRLTKLSKYFFLAKQQKPGNFDCNFQLEIPGLDPIMSVSKNDCNLVGKWRLIEHYTTSQLIKPRPIYTIRLVVYDSYPGV